MDDNSIDDQLHAVADRFETRRFKVNLIQLLVLGAVGAVVIALMLPSVQRSREAARRTQCKNNHKQLMLAFINYRDEYGTFPPAFTVDAQGKPLHSWRTLLLPYLDQTELYKKIDLCKAWDDPANLEAFQSAKVNCFQCPSAVRPPHHTTYQAIVGSEYAFDPTTPRVITDFTDGASNTLMIVEVPLDKSVPWMSPIDHGADFLVKSEEKSKVHIGGTHAAFADGTVRFIGTNVKQETRKALMTIDGGVPICGDF